MGVLGGHKHTPAARPGGHRGKLVREKGSKRSWPLSLPLGAAVLIKTLPTPQSPFLLHVLPRAPETIRSGQPSWQVRFSVRMPKYCSLLTGCPPFLKEGRFFRCQKLTANCVMGLCPLNPSKTEASF